MSMEEMRREICRIANEMEDEDLLKALCKLAQCVEIKKRP